MISFISLTTIWNYTTLKQRYWRNRQKSRLTTIWNYTTLKLKEAVTNCPASLTTIWNYTTLKRAQPSHQRGWGVWLPYEITLLSNVSKSSQGKPFCLTTIWNYTTLKPRESYSLIVDWFDYHMKLHYSQTLKLDWTYEELFDYHMKLHYSQTKL